MTIEDTCARSMYETPHPPTLKCNTVVVIDPLKIISFDDEQKMEDEQMIIYIFVIGLKTNDETNAFFLEPFCSEMYYQFDKLNEFLFLCRWRIKVSDCENNLQFRIFDKYLQSVKCCESYPLMDEETDSWTIPAGISVFFLDFKSEEKNVISNNKKIAKYCLDFAFDKVLYFIKI